MVFLSDRTSDNIFERFLQNHLSNFNMLEELYTKGEEFQTPKKKSPKTVSKMDVKLIYAKTF